MKKYAPNPTKHNQWYPFQDRPLPPETGQVAENPSVVPVFELLTIRFNITVESQPEILLVT